jgi:signal transduction histidine kinase
MAIAATRNAHGREETMERGTQSLTLARNELEALRRSLARPLDRKVLAALLSPLLVVVVAALAFLGIHSVRESQVWVSHTREVIDVLRQTELSLVDAETEQRAYLLTHAPGYLHAYQAAAQHNRRLLDMLTELVRDNPAQSGRASEVHLQSERKLAQLATTLELYERSGIDSAREYILSGYGAQQLELARAKVKEMVDAELAILMDRNSRRDREIDLTKWIIAVGSLCAVVLAVLVNIGIRHDLTIQRVNQRVLEEQAARLETQRSSLERSEQALARQLEAERSLSDRLAAASAAAELALAERNAAGTALERSNRELNQFAYVASHDLKAPLRGIANLAQWVEEDLGEAMTERSREHIRVLLSRVRRMEALIDGILAFARAGRGEGHREEIDVGQLVQEVRELLAPPAGLFAVDVSPDLPRVSAVRAPFQQVWMNLLGNAFKHARREGGEVRVSALDRGTQWEFSVADNGPGIAPQYHQRVFGIFQTLAARDKVEGTGIGLATVKKLVESEGGAVWVESQAGQGATFRFTWPKMQARS